MIAHMIEDFCSSDYSTAPFLLLLVLLPEPGESEEPMQGYSDQTLIIQILRSCPIPTFLSRNLANVIPRKHCLDFHEAASALLFKSCSGGHSFSCFAYLHESSDVQWYKKLKSRHAECTERKVLFYTIIEAEAFTARQTPPEYIDWSC